MPWPLTIAADADTADLRIALSGALGLGDAGDGTADIVLAARPPAAPAAHVILAGPLEDEVDAWDEALPAQTVSGALWLVPGQSDLIRNELILPANRLVRSVNLDDPATCRSALEAVIGQFREKAEAAKGATMRLELPSEG